MVETLGRRNLLLMGAIGMAVCQFIVAGVGTGAAATDLPAQRALIAFVCIYIFFFASSWGKFYHHDQLMAKSDRISRTMRMGCHWRNLPAQGQSQVSCDDHRLVRYIP